MAVHSSTEALASAHWKKALSLALVTGTGSFGYLLYRANAARLLLARLAILAIQAGTPAAFLLVLRNCHKLFHSKRTWHLGRWLRWGLGVWATAEVVFVFYYLACKRRLDRQTTRRWQAVPVHSTPEKRLKSLERYLLSLEQVGGQAKFEASSSSTLGDRPKSQGSIGPGFAGAGGGLRRMTAGPTPHLNQTLGGAGGGGLLRQMSTDMLSRVSSFNLLGGAPNREESVADLMKLWEGQKDVSDVDTRKLKLLELAAFFTGPGRGDCEDVGQWLKIDNVMEWVAHYWFRGAKPEEMDPKHKQECRKLVDLVLKDAGLEYMAPGYNKSVKCYRTFTDPLPVAHRPLAVYFGTSVLCPLLTMEVMRWMGFRREHVGGLVYWKREPRKDVKPSEDINGGSHTPMVFVHGLGVGLVPYYDFIRRLSRRHSGDMYVPEFPCLAMAPWESVPSAREVVAQLQDMLAANGHTSAHFVGHSFGSLIIGWMLKMSPSSMVYATLMEPAQFLLMKSECLCKVLHGTTTTPYEALIRYFGFRELFTVNLLCRNFFWEQSTMWPEDITVPCLIQLAGGDHIVQSTFIRRLLAYERHTRKQQARAAKPKLLSALPKKTGSSVDLCSDTLNMGSGKAKMPEVLDVCWFDNFLHGEILGRPREQMKLFEKMRNMREAADAQK
mmetsp:Transcript_30061/g.64923  ORF Transcript_30061/g.64923 Transcript_30061/m.64923 type:complete len:667 (+) Transcript_30061:113-2113(+)|eukprot:CAMPEP_0206490344 /NCGR_PEP_ID=MMETSP0324_2-20121206/43982_1 /ASSEMBLY_ACC=CAM_ASM_000836 /TAXON_ID=2866 /ORGANISM="Crypthecodinium cohnii, Strain Seligo" /LENGTH=666 /DNA_ID=CAMNT_0053970601 /DNA_START=68 /DNA_END=2068 /DNA_ORIENTATION=+